MLFAATGLVACRPYFEGQERETHAVRRFSKTPVHIRGASLPIANALSQVSTPPPRSLSSRAQSTCISARQSAVQLTNLPRPTSFFMSRSMRSRSFSCRRRAISEVRRARLGVALRGRHATDAGSCRSLSTQRRSTESPRPTSFDRSDRSIARYPPVQRPGANNPLRTIYVDVLAFAYLGFLTLSQASTHSEEVRGTLAEFSGGRTAFARLQN